MNSPRSVSADGALAIREPTEPTTDSRVRTRSAVGATTHHEIPGTEAAFRTRFRRVPDGEAAGARYRWAVTNAERDQDAPTPVEVLTEEGPALRDATEVAARAARDATDAADARARFQDEPLPILDADARIGRHLDRGEGVHSVRASAILHAPGGDRALGYGGTLYLTSRRLVHLGQVNMSVQLTDIVETSLAGERLLIALRDGEGLAFDLDRPRRLRAELAAAMRALR